MTEIFVLIVAKCIVNYYSSQKLLVACCRINSSKVYCKFFTPSETCNIKAVLIVAKCIVNYCELDVYIDDKEVLIVAKCIVNSSSHVPK